MKKRILSILISSSLMLGMFSTISIDAAAVTGFEGEEWYDQIETVQVNRENAHSNFIPYQDAQTALENEQSVFTKDLAKSDYYKTLNGEWDFYFAKKPADRLSDPDDNTIDWSGKLNDSIKVPSSIETQVDEKGQFKYATPIYINQEYPWENYEPVTYISELATNAKAPVIVNGVAHYERKFTLPQDWESRQVFVSFQGVESAFYLYINGTKVGYGEDSYTADDFNITQYLQAGENTISVQVYRWSTGSYLENQDFIRLSGIFREVYLYSKSDVEIRDFFLKPELNDDFSVGTLNAEIDIRNLVGDAKTGSVDIQIYKTATNQPVCDKISVDYSVEQANIGTELIADRGVTVTGSITVDQPELWTDDAPNLYSVLMQLKDADGNVVETVCQRVGFRKIENVIINDDGQYQLQVNGAKVMFRGVNRHETHLEDGRAIDFETIKTDLLMMKQNNVNAIRTAHYPNNVWTYDLADELGIYICDEANIESHKGAFSATGIPSKYPIWETAVMDRTQNMVERDKNHASIVIWSLGNEATYETYTMDENYCFYTSTQWILQRDPSRIRKYERDNRYSLTENGDIDRENSMVDIYSSQYWSVSAINSHISDTNNKLPYIQSEYSHAMGNAIGNLKEYWDVFRQNDNAQGGFIWDWVDQSIITTDQVDIFYGVKDDVHNIAADAEGVDFIDIDAVDSYNVTTLSSAPHADTNGMTLDVYFTLPAGFQYTSGNQYAIISNGDYGYNLKINNKGHIEAFFSGWRTNEGGHYCSAPMPSTFCDGNTHRLTATIDSDGYLTIYYDSAVIGTTKTTASTDYDTNESVSVMIGNDIDYPTLRKWPGTINSVRIMKECMSASAITSGMVATDNENVLIGIDYVEERTDDKALSGYIDLPKTTHADTNEMTLDAYVRLPSGYTFTSGSDYSIIGNGDDGYNLKINKQGNFEVFFSGWKNGTLSATVPTGFNDGKWHRVTTTIDSTGKMSLYVDLNLIATSTRTASSDYDTNTRGISIGNDIQYNIDRHWPGEIDSFRIMKKCMSIQEIAKGMVAKNDENVIVGMDFAASEFGTVVLGEYTDNYWWGYGGDWGETMHSGNFVGNGILPADRSASAKLAEVKKVLQQVNFYDDGELKNGKVRVVNEYTAKNLNEFDITWTLVKNNTVIASDTVTLDLEPLSQTSLQMNWSDLGEIRRGDDYFVNFDVSLKQSTSWAEAGYVIAQEQFEIGLEATKDQPVIDGESMSAFENVDNGDTTLTITGNDGSNAFEIVFDKTTGYITSYKYADNVLMTEGPVPNYYRAGIDNDRNEKDDSNLANTKDKFDVSNVTVTQPSDKILQIVVEGAVSTASPSPNTISYTVFSNGEIVVNNNVTINADSNTSIKRIGMKISVPDEYENFTYYGRGPWENYIDRNTGSFIDVYQTTVEEIDEANKYLKPQENGNHTDTRFSAVTNSQGAGFMVVADDVMETSLSQYEDEDLASYKHMYEVPKADGYLVLNIDEIQRGLGGASCGPKPLTEYVIQNNTTYSQTFRIVPFLSASTDEMMEESKKNVNAADPIEDITVSGTYIGFEKDKYEYDVKIAKSAFDEIPEVEVEKMGEDTVVEFEQPTSLPADVTVNAVSTFGIEKTYTLHIEEVDELYVSDMVWTVDHGGYFPNQRDASNTNGADPVSVYVDGTATTYQKGVGTHSNSQIDVDISNMNLTKFTSLAGINTVQSGNGNVIFYVYVDDVLKAQVNKLVNEDATLLEVDVTDANVVSLRVDMNGTDGSDHATWADAKFIHEHNFSTKDSGNKASDATCEQKQQNYVQCDNCYVVSDTITVEVGDFAQHSFTDVDAKQKTCTEDGYTAYKYCSECEYIEGKEIIPAGHTITKVDGKKATVDADGWKDYYECEICGAYFEDEGAATEIADLDAWKTGDGKLTYKEAQNITTGEKYATLEEALDAANSGETVTLLEDAEVRFATVRTGVTLDINGHKLTADYVTGFDESNIIDSNVTEDSGIYVAKKQFAVSENNSQLPIYDAVNGCYVFTDVDLSYTYYADSSYYFGPETAAFDTVEGARVNALLRENSADTGVSIIVHLDWETDDYYSTQDFTYKPAYVEQYFTMANEDGHYQNVYFYATFTGDVLKQADLVTVTTIVQSDRGFKALSESKTFTMQ